MHSLTLRQIEETLRIRVLQELQILARKIRRPRPATATPLITRLTRAQWTQIQATGIVPFKGAVAVIVLPPVNRDPITGQRPQPHTTSMPLPEAADVGGSRRDAPGHASESSEPTDSRKFPRREYPSSTLMYQTPENSSLVGEELNLLPSKRVPVYHSVSMFPSPMHRAALLVALKRVLHAERCVVRSGSALAESLGSGRGKGQNKGSHAFMICSDESTLLRGDTVPAVVALWRLRMWLTGANSDMSDPSESMQWTIPPVTN